MKSVSESAALVISLAVAALASAAGTREASCVIRILGNDLALPLSDRLIQEILQSEPFEARTANVVLKEASGHAGIYTIAFETIDEMATGVAAGGQSVVGRARMGGMGSMNLRHVLVGKLGVTIAEGGPPVAAELLTAVCNELRAALDQLYASDMEMERDQVAAYEQRVVDLEQRHAELVQQIEALKAKTSGDSLAGWTPVSTQKLAMEIDELKRNLASNRARHDAIAVQLAELNKNAQAQASQNPLLEQLAQIVRVREEQLAFARMAFEEGSASKTEIGELEAALADAQVALIRGREESLERVMAGMAGDLKRKLVDLSIENAEFEARLRERSERLAEVQSAGLDELGRKFEQKLMPELEQVERQLAETRSELEHARARAASARPPRLDVIVGR